MTTETVAAELLPAERWYGVIDAIETRRAVRAFGPNSVPLTIVRRILETLCDRCIGAFFANPLATGERVYYPTPLPEPYRSRQIALGKALYGALGIPRGDKERMLNQMARNWRFFDAPIGIIFTIDSRLELGSWIDYGAFLQNVMLTARAYGLATCPQEAWCTYPGVVREVLGFGPEESIVCGMALGVADGDKPENRFVVDRESVDQFASFLGFPDDAAVSVEVERQELARPHS